MRRLIRTSGPPSPSRGSKVGLAGSTRRIVPLMAYSSTQGGQYEQVVLQEQSTLPVKNARRMHEIVSPLLGTPRRGEDRCWVRFYLPAVPLTTRFGQFFFTSPFISSTTFVYLASSIRFLYSC